jgi:hypothetical protein
VKSPNANGSAGFGFNVASSMLSATCADALREEHCIDASIRAATLNFK